MFTLALIVRRDVIRLEAGRRRGVAARAGPMHARNKDDVIFFLKKMKDKVKDEDLICFVKRNV